MTTIFAILSIAVLAVALVTPQGRRVLASERGTLDLSSFAAALKTLYPDKKINDLVYADNPLLAMMAKDEKFYGENMKCPLIYGNPQARSASIANAITQSAGASSKLKAFLLTRAKDYSLAQIDHETLKASEADYGAFLRAATLEIDGAIHSAARSLAIAMYRTGSGSIGRVANSSFATTTLTLTEPDDVTNFEVGQTLVVSDVDGGGAVRVGTLFISGIDRVVGTLTTSVNLSTGIAAIAQNDFIFCQGDYDLKVKGLQAWMPYGGPSATAFFGVDRTADRTRLAGSTQDGVGKPIEEALYDIANFVGREGGGPDRIFMNFTDYGNLEKSMQGRAIYVNVQAPDMPEIGFQGIKVNGPRGPMTVIPDQNAPAKYAFVLKMSTWTLHSLGKAPQLFNTDGLDMLRNPLTDSLDVRVYYYAQVGCRAPGWNGVVKLR
jgi:hypothetical protein